MYTYASSPQEIQNRADAPGHHSSSPDPPPSACDRARVRRPAASSPSSALATASTSAPGSRPSVAALEYGRTSVSRKSSSRGTDSPASCSDAGKKLSLG